MQNAYFDKIENFDSGSNYNFRDKMLIPDIQRSLYDWSHTVTTTIENCGHLVPIQWLETVPDSDIEINASALLRYNPQVVPMFTRQRLYIYAFWNRLGDLWNNFDVFIRKGRTGNVIKKIPHYTPDNVYSGGVNDSVQSVSIGGYLGLPKGLKISNSTNNPDISVLPHMQIFRVYRDYFLNPDVDLEADYLFPDDDSRFRVDDNGLILSYTDAGKIAYWDLYNYSPSDYDSDASHIGLFFHNYPKDRFTSALPFQQRGDTPDIKFVMNKSFNIDSSDMFDSSQSVGGSSKLSFVTDSEVPGFNSYAVPTYDASTNAANLLIPQFVNALNKQKVTITDTGISLTMAQFRELAISQMELERAARTDGSFAEFGLTFFGESSKNAYDYKPVFVGATYTNVQFSEILQTAPTSLNNEDQPLGTMAGHGIAGISNNYIGKVHCDDYGILQFFACIMPDVEYFQGVQKKFQRSLQSDFFLTGRDKLGLIPILNSELYYSNGSSSNQSLFAYQDPFDELRYVENKISGLISDSSSASYFPYTQARNFANLPVWSTDFLQASNVRKDYLASAVDPMCMAQFHFDIRAVLPLAYYSKPANIIG